MTKEETILSQKGDQYLEELAIPELANEDKEKLSNHRKYDEELEMLEYWLINPSIDKDDYSMLDCNIQKQHIQGRNIELCCKLVDGNREPKE